MAKCVTCGTELGFFTFACPTCAQLAPEKQALTSKAVAQESSRDSAHSGPASDAAYLGWASFLLVASIALCLIGFFVMYNHPGYGNSIANHDLDYVIIAIRGVGFICAGGVFGLAACLILLLLDGQSTPWKMISSACF